jgi:RNA-binding protein
VTKDQQKQFRTQAHILKPVVMIGHSGLSDAVLKEIEIALSSHELIKIKIQTDDRETRKQISIDICSKCKAEFIQSIGKILVIYKKNLKK